MQPKFTPKNSVFFCAKIIAIALIFLASTQTSIAQEQSGKFTNQKPGYENTQSLFEKQKAQQGLKNIEPAKISASVPAPSVGWAPVQIGTNTITPNNPNAGNPFSRAFCYNGPAGAFQLNKQSVLNTVLTTIGAPFNGVFPGATAWVTTTNLLYEIDQGAPFGLYTVDTITGVRTFIVNCTGVPQANLTGMTWDATTNTMYGVSTSLAISQIFTMNIVSGVCTPIGAATAVAPGVIMINAAPSGTLFSVDIVTDNLYRWNKTTGVPTLIGSLGVDANFGQDGHFDPSDGQYYWAAIGNGLGASLRILDTTTALNTLVGTYAGQVETFAIYSAPLTPCTGTPVPGNTIGTPNPVGSGAPLTLSIQNNPPASGFIHYWQSSPTGSAPWTNIGNTPGNTFVTSQTAATWYRDSVRCTVSGQFGISTPVQVNLLACAWSVSTAYPIPILDQGCVTIGNTFYSFAGVSNGAVIANSYSFNGTTWTPIAPTPQGLEYPGVCTDGTNIYIAGGASTVGTPLTTFYRYNVASNTYTTLAPFSTGVWNPALVFIAGKIYKIAGTGPATASTNAVEIYDVASNTWSAGANYPLASSFVSAVAQGGFIYAGGGFPSGSVATLKTYRYDPAGNSWNDAAIADLPATRWGAASAWYNNGLILAGGYVGGSVTANILPSVVQWNLATNSWVPLDNMITGTARVGGAAFGIGGSFHVVGGRTQASAGFVGTTQNQRLFCIPPTPCSGTPNPGNTISSTNPVCSGVGFTLSLQNNPFESGFTYLWQSAPAAAGPWTNLPGGTNVTHSLSQTGATWYRAIVTCTPSGLSGTSTPLLVADGQGVFTSQPVSTSVVCGGNATFSYTATGNSLTYAWEYRTSPAGFWLNVTGAPIAGATVSGQTTNTLTLTNVSAALNGYQFRGLIQGPCTAVDFTNAVTLTVTPFQVTVNPPITNPVTICAGTVQQISITNTVAGSSTLSFTSGPLNFNVPDENAAPSLFTIPVSGIPAGSLITNVRVHLNMTHTYPADMVINLKGAHPTNILSLYKHHGNTNNGAVSIPTAGFYDAVVNMTSSTAFVSVLTPFRYGMPPTPGPYRPDALNGVTNPGYTIMDPTGWASNSLTFPSLFNAGSPNGTWTLAMCDGGPGDLGNFTGWTIDIDYVAPVFAQGVWTGPAGTMWNNAAANSPYVAGTPQTTIYVNPTVNSNYTVVVTTATPCVSDPKVITVNVTNPVAGLVAPANKTVCVGTNTSFSVAPTGGPLTYQWEVSVNSGLTWSPISGATGATLTLNGVTQLMNNNLYRVTVTASPCGSVTTAPTRLNVNQLPTVTISSTFLQLVPGRVATITGTSSPAPFSATSWSWTRNGATIVTVPASNTNSISVNIDQQGAYRATVTDINGCVNSSNIITIGSEASDYLWIYPNPNSGQFQVRLYYSGTQAERRIVRIYNITGQLVAQQEFDLDTNTSPYLSMSFDLPLLSAGTYAVKVVDRNGKRITSGLMVIQ